VGPNIKNVPPRNPTHKRNNKPKQQNSPEFLVKVCKLSVRAVLQRQTVNTNQAHTPTKTIFCSELLSCALKIKAKEIISNDRARKPLKVLDIRSRS
jgi:hypothetical protein